MGLLWSPSFSLDESLSVPSFLNWKCGSLVEVASGVLLRRAVAAAVGRPDIAGSIVV